MSRYGRKRIAAVLAVIALSCGAVAPTWAASGAELGREARAALQSLYAHEESARLLGKKATAILVFPSILKAGFMFGGQIGEGAMLRGGKTVGYYNSVAASYGLQAGIQTFGYALMFMDQASLDTFNAADGFEIGVGPSVVVVDQGMGKTLTTSTIRKGIYAFIFSQKGLMAGLGVQGSKITQISK